MRVILTTLLLPAKLRITRDRMKKDLILFVCILSLSSCRFYDKLFNEDVVARVGKNVLYQSDIENLNIKGHGLTPEDSSRAVMQYIYSWAKDLLLMDMAEKQLSEKDKDVEKQLEDYRRQLLVFRYEKKYVEQRLDTAISETQYRALYDAHPENFHTNVSLVKGSIIKIADDSPYLSVVKNLYRSKKPENMQKLEDICYASAEWHKIYDDWISIEVVAQELDIDISYCENKFAQSLDYITQKDHYAYLVTLDDIIRRGSLAPFEYSRSKIRDIILSKRKQELIASLERNLLNDAIGSDKLIIYSK